MENSKIKMIYDNPDIGVKVDENELVYLNDEFVACIPEGWTVEEYVKLAEESKMLLK